MTRYRPFLTLNLTLLLYLTGAAGLAQAAGENEPAAPLVRLDTPSGHPVPRIVSLKAETTYCRGGPSFQHPVRLTFKRRGLPVIVIAETHDHWRKIRDLEGDECWTHRSKLSGADMALVIEDGLPLRVRPNADSPVKARLGEGVIAKVAQRRDNWVRISTQGMKGWARADALWGAQADAPLSPASH